MNEYQWYHDSLPPPPQVVYTEKKEKKGIPVWVVALITSGITSAVLIAVFAGFIFPNLPTPTKIYYSETPRQTPSADFSGSSMPIAQIAEQCSPSTVYVSSTGIIGGFFSQQVSLGDGSGVIVSEDGYIITSSSVVNSGTEIKVTLNDGREFAAMIVGSDQKTDIAVLKIEADGLTPAILGNSQGLMVGEPILAIGNPFGPKITNTVAYGIISAVKNNVSLQKGASLNLLLSDANIPVGYAGGAFFNAGGEIIGIVVANVSSEASVAFAIPINDVKPLLTSFLNIENAVGENSDTPMFGITGTEEPYGVVVETVSENYPAAKAGMKVGDVIMKVDGTPVTTVQEINNIRLSRQRGDTVSITIFRDGETLELSVVLD